jgi:hypothetical protein
MWRITSSDKLSLFPEVPSKLNSVSMILTKALPRLDMWVQAGRTRPLQIASAFDMHDYLESFSLQKFTQLLALVRIKLYARRLRKLGYGFDNHDFEIALMQVVQIHSKIGRLHYSS